jgi:hypothetical protein
MDCLSAELPKPEMRDEFRCRCGAQARLIRKIMDPRNGLTVRIFECRCGQHSWTEEKQ